MRTLLILTAISAVTFLNAAQMQTTPSKPVSSTVVSADQPIAKKLGDELKKFPTVKFDVRNGQVTLSGTVKNLEDKATIEKDIRKIDGVRSINNMITVQPDAVKK